MKIYQILAQHNYTPKVIYILVYTKKSPIYLPQYRGYCIIIVCTIFTCWHTATAAEIPDVQGNLTACNLTCDNKIHMSFLMCSFPLQDDTTCPVMSCTDHSNCSLQACTYLGSISCLTVCLDSRWLLIICLGKNM